MSQRLVQIFSDVFYFGYDGRRHSAGAAAAVEGTGGLGYDAGFSATYVADDASARGRRRFRRYDAGFPFGRRLRHGDCGDWRGNAAERGS